jgi:WD40 repeat protein
MVWRLQPKWLSACRLPGAAAEELFGHLRQKGPALMPGQLAGRLTQEGLDGGSQLRMNPNRIGDHPPKISCRDKPAKTGTLFSADPLNENYRAALASLTGSSHEALRNAQRAWVTTRDADLAAFVATGLVRSERNAWAALRHWTERRVAFLRIASPAQPMTVSKPNTDAATPILRIEAGMHTAPILKLSSDAAGRFALTASDDKTARLWEIPSGRPLRILRPPIGEGNKGKIGACALIPDGSLAAVGGSSGAGLNENHIDLFDPVSGRLLRRLEEMPFILDLAFSHDGRYLAAALGLKSGLRVFDSSTGREIGRDENYPYSCMSVDWAQDGRLLTVSGDPTLRIYKEGMALVPQLRSGSRSTAVFWKPVLEADAGQDGLIPIRARFSPDGRRIAVGFDDYTSVSVYDGHNLSHLFKPDLTGLPGGKGWGGLYSLTWSVDSSTLAAGGRWQDGNNRYPIRRWDQSGKGRAQDIPATSKGLNDLRCLPDGSILFGSEDPVFGLLSPSGKLNVLGRSPIADFRDAGQNDNSVGKNVLEVFRLSDDALDVGFGFEYGGKPRARFSLRNRTLELLENGNWPAGLSLPKLTGIAVTSWQESHFAALDGRQLDLGQEYSHCLAIALDASYFILGTQSAIYCFNPQGRQRWKQLSFGGTWAVNLSADGKLAVAAFGDGTIRWFRAQDGRELLTLFPHADRKRWVLWTPEGYYDCSPGAEDLIGWQVNRERGQAADFFPATRFRAVYYRPDVIQRVLKTRDVAEALRQANAALGCPTGKPEDIRTVIEQISPPVVELTTGGVLATTTVPRAARSVPVQYRVRQTGQEPPTKVSMHFNGRPVDLDAPLPRAGQDASIDVPVPEGAEGEISILAEHKFGVSEAASLRVKREGGSAQPASQTSISLPAASTIIKPTAAESRKRTAQIRIEIRPHWLTLKFRFQTCPLQDLTHGRSRTCFPRSPGGHSNTFSPRCCLIVRQPRKAS